MRILIVEDQLLIATQLQLVAEAAGHVVVGLATTAAEATEMVAAFTPDIAFVDINLEDKSGGLDVASFISAAYEALVVFVTANAKMIPEDYCGAVGFVEKPFTEIGLLLVFTYLGGKLQRRPMTPFLPDTLRLSPAYARLWT